jgi:hypothetical protein
VAEVGGERNFEYRLVPWTLYGIHFNTEYRESGCNLFYRELKMEKVVDQREGDFHAGKYNGYVRDDARICFWVHLKTDPCIIKIGFSATIFLHDGYNAHQPLA